MTIRESPPVEKNKKTIFKRMVSVSGQPGVSFTSQPENYNNVMFIGHDPGYGDVFKAWDDHSSYFILYFGEKGNEFND